ncbi:hypothetical protein [Desulfobotulus mexicanus]|uniref:Uncharacterized protein n=1 Tax=Desulfobotulus mexicanus TaxID=2586642 RepID=A0A5Q4VCZ4_9BACT|nr:hypothetical protein [Desulfobotulus mexicanus]TYT74838.1 hypothetical protein FIM25_08300 [Desulfobotulus mexicanus]
MSSPAPLAILFSGGSDSLALYTMALSGHHRAIPKTSSVHLVTMLNGMARFPHFTENRFRTARELLEKQQPSPLPPSFRVELDCGRLFQELWLDRYETLMPRFGGKNLVCVACKLAMHTRILLYCLEQKIPAMLAGYTLKQSFYPEQTPAFMDRMKIFSEDFDIKTTFPVYEDFSETAVSRHYLEDQGLPSSGGGERKCLFSQTRTTATEEETAAYLDAMIPVVSDYIRLRRKGDVAAAARAFHAIDSTTA